MKEFLKEPAAIVVILIGIGFAILATKSISSPAAPTPSLTEVHPRAGVTCFVSETHLPQYTRSISCFKE